MPARPPVSERIQFVLPVALADALRDKAEKDGVSMGAVVRDALVAYMKLPLKVKMPNTHR